MTPDELHDTLNRIGWTLEKLAHRSGRSYSRVRKMASGRDLIDDPLADWLRRIANAPTYAAGREVVRNPPPLPQGQVPDEPGEDIEGYAKRQYDQAGP